MPTSSKRRRGNAASSPEKSELIREVSDSQSQRLPARAQAEAMLGIAMRNLSGLELAFYLKRFYPSLNNGEVAEKCGVHRTTLYRSPEFRRLNMLTKSSSRPRGFVNDEGNLEAWDDADR